MYTTLYMGVSYMLQVLRDCEYLTTVKYYDELFRKVKIYHFVRKIGLPKK